MPRESAFLKLVATERPVVPLHVRIKEDQNPLFLWGCGNVASSVHEYCRQFGIALAGCFADAGTVQDAFQGLPVFSLDEITAQYPQFSVVIGHSHYREGMSRLDGAKGVAAVYCVTSCIYQIWDPIPAAFLAEQSEILDQIYDSLEDGLSKECMLRYFESRVNDRAEYIFPCTEQPAGYYSNDVFSLTGQEVLLDVGAWEGAAIWPFIEAVEGKYRHIIALEPDERNFRVLTENIKSRGTENITAKMVCAYDRDGAVKFETDPTDGQMGGINGQAQNYRLCPARKIDSLWKEGGPFAGISLVKINFVFSVAEVLGGAAELLKTQKPKLIVRVGFEENALLKTYIALKQINPAYKLYFRYTVGMPQGLTLFAV